jgi:hypothetical protein
MNDSSAYGFLRGFSHSLHGNSVETKTNRQRLDQMRPPEN